MGVITTHLLEIASEGHEKNITKLLTDAGVLSEKELFYYDYRNCCPVYTKVSTAIDYNKAPKEIAEKERKHIEEKGIWIMVPGDSPRIESYMAAGFKKTEEDPQTHYITLRKDISKKAIEASMGYKVCLHENDNKFIFWNINYGYDDTPAYIISTIFPDIEFEYREVVENDLVCHSIMKNGEVIKDFIAESKAA